MLYAATLQALALGTRHIIEEMNKVCHDGHNLIGRLVIAFAPS